MKLSWPDPKDDRRNVVGKLSSSKAAGHTSEARFVHTSLEDFEMNRHLTASGPNGSTPPFLNIPQYWNPHKLKVGEQDLLQYFQDVASQALTTFDHSSTDLGSFLLRVSLSDNTQSAAAALNALLAFASLHKHGVQSQAAELKISALSALATAAQGDELSTTEAVQHVAAGMLLYSFEIQRACCTSSQWTRHLSSVMTVIDTTHLGMVQDDNIATLLEWVYYNDVLSRFSLQHWEKEDPQGPPTLSTPSTTLSSVGSSEISFMAFSSTSPLLKLLSELFDSIYTEARSVEVGEEHKKFLKVLDWRIRSTSADIPVDQLYQLAMLIYLDRTSKTLADQPLRMQQHIDNAFSIISQLDYCPRQFPVFILGCEARTDSRRVLILDLISRTEKQASSRSFNYVRLLIQAIWTQEDLTDIKTGDLDYWNKLSSTISRCAIPPTFV